MSRRLITGTGSASAQELIQTPAQEAVVPDEPDRLDDGVPVVPELPLDHDAVTGGPGHQYHLNLVCRLRVFQLVIRRAVSRRLQ